MAESKRVIYTGTMCFFEGDIVNIFLKGADHRMVVGKLTMIGTESFRIDASERYHANIEEHAISEIDLISLEERTWA